VVPLTGYAPVTVASGEGLATPLPYHGSGHLASLADSDGYAVIEPDADPARDPVPVRLWTDPLSQA
jgi:molybdopterin biosynthesis enzyme